MILRGRAETAGIRGYPGAEGVKLSLPIFPRLPENVARPRSNGGVALAKG